MFKAVQRGIKRGFTEIEILFRRARRGTSLPSGRIFRMTYAMIHHPDHQRSRLTGARQPVDRAEDKEKVSSAPFSGEIDAELDRLIEGRPRQPQRGGRRIVMLTCPGGNG